MGLLAIALPDWRQLYLGVALGALAGMYVPLLGSPPEWIERKRRGRDGERRTEKALRPLEAAGWVVVHDIPARHGNFDHVVVGRRGAYLLETKTFAGEAFFEDGALTLRRGDDDRDAWRVSSSLASGAKRAAARVRSLRDAANIRWVNPVVVLWCEFSAQMVQHAGVTYVHGDALAEWLAAQPEQLPEDAVALARRCLEPA